MHNPYVSSSTFFAASQWNRFSKCQKEHFPVFLVNQQNGLSEREKGVTPQFSSVLVFGEVEDLGGGGQE